MKCAAAVFVKTPGISPLKTRLANAIGSEAAERFHVLSSRAIQATVSEAALLTAGALLPFWAVAEKSALKNRLWGVFPVLHQGEGELGPRLHKVYSELLARGGAAMLLGADSPQLPASLLVDTLQKLASPEVDFVAGPADDGGFYLFAGKRPIPAEAWESVPYSEPDTLKALSKALAPLGRLEILLPQFDIDSSDDLPKLVHALDELSPDACSHEQAELLAWLRKLPKKQ